MSLLLPALLLLCGSSSASETFEGYTYYIGDPHVHTGVSGDGFSSDLYDGCGEYPCGAIADLFETAVSNGLDWFATTDHVTGASCAEDSAYAMLLKMLLDHDDESTGLVVVPGAEIALNHATLRGLGHRNLYFFGSDDQLASLKREAASPRHMSIESCEMITTHLQNLEDAYGPVFSIPHHPCVRLPASVRWDCVSEEYDVGVEVYSSFGTCLGSSWNYDMPRMGGSPFGLVERAISPDYYSLKLAFLGGTDLHTTLPGDLCAPYETSAYASSGGLTIVMVPEDEPWERMAIYDAVMARRTIASTGPLIPVVVEYRAGGMLIGGLGQEFAVIRDATLDVEIRVPPEWEFAVAGVHVATETDIVELEQDDDGSWRTLFEPEEVPYLLYPAVEIDGDLYWGEDRCDDGGTDDMEWLWGSPSWIFPADSDGDGWDDITWGGLDCDDSDPSVHPGAAETWSDGIDSDCLGDSDFRADSDDTSAFGLMGLARRWTSFRLGSLF